MKIIRWLLSHIFLILLIIIVIYGYMFWGNLLGEDTPAGKAIAYLSDEFPAVEEFVTAVKEKQAKLSASDDAPSASTDAAPAEPVISYSYNQTQITQDAQGVVEKTEPAATSSAPAPSAAPASDGDVPGAQTVGSHTAGAQAPAAAVASAARPMQTSPAQPEAQSIDLSAHSSSIFASILGHPPSIVEDSNPELDARLEALLAPHIDPSRPVDPLISMATPNSAAFAKTVSTSNA